MLVNEDKAGDVVVLGLAGRLDSNTSKEFDDRLAEVVGNSRATLLDLSALDYVSSAGLRVLLKAAKLAKAKQSRLALAALQPNVREVFEISGFATIFVIYDGRESALAAMG